MDFSRLLNEPQALLSAVRAVIFAFTAFGFNLTIEQIGAVMGALEAVLLVLGRALVVPVKLAEQREARGMDLLGRDK